MEIPIEKLLILCPLIFLAGFIDSIAGGGGLIAMPSYMLIGLPPHSVLGTNKLSSSLGTLVATIRYAKNKQIHFATALPAAAAAILGSYGGAQLALSFDEGFLKMLLVILLPVIAVYILTKRRFGEENKISMISLKKAVILSVLAGLLIGVYDGFFGPGTGTLLMLAFTGVIGFDLATASGNTKVVNLASNIAAIAAYISSGVVVFAIGIPAAICGMLGNWLGSGFAIKNGARVIRPVFIGVLVLLFGKVLWDLLAVSLLK